MAPPQGNMNDTQFIQGGYAKHNLTREYVTEVHSRTSDEKGRVWRGEAGRQLRRRKIEEQNYYQRNRSK